MRTRVIAAFAVLSLALVGGPQLGSSVAKVPSDAGRKRLDQAASPDYYKNLAAPRVDPRETIEKPGAPDDKAAGSSSTAARNGIAAWWNEQERKYSGGFPRAARMLGQLEAEAARTGKSPQQLKAERAGGDAGDTQVAEVLTILAEFNPDANDDFSGWERPTSDVDETCFTEPGGTTQSGPLHNNLPDPATVGDGTDNNTPWVDDFTPEHYNKLLFTEEGLTERIRPDLTGPDGQPGIDISGYTMRNMYLEMSKGAYTVDGVVAPWVQLPHSEGYYGADSCEAGVASDVGHPDNPRGVTQMIVDAVDALAAEDPGFDWERFDKEDQGDLDDDGNLLEPDGVVDHFNIVHAGADEADSGGDEGTYAIWSHASVVDAIEGGYEVPGTDIKVFNYITQAEDAGVGVFAHEFGHDLGLPDLYDTSGAGDSDVEFWDLMSTGSHSGPIFQGIPIHMGAWDKYVLGWNDPEELNLGDDPTTLQLGQASMPPDGTEDSVKINLPDKVIELGEPHSGENMWWSSNDQPWADLRLKHTFDVPDGEDVRFWVWNDYQIEEDWDYGFIEVSTDGGNTWIQENVFNEAGELVSTPDDYTDPNNRLNDYGGLVHGLTGFTDGWRHDYIDLTPYAGTTIDVRLRYATDAAFEERGWFSDDFKITADGNSVFTDDVESGPGDWEPEVNTFAGTKGKGWHIFDGTAIYEQYYMAEWRSNAGFDEGLKYTYNTSYFVGREWKVERVPYNAPGLLLWYRNAQFSVNHVTVPIFELPSAGSKGLLLLVDSHYDPLRLKGKAAKWDPSTLKNIPSRPQASNAAFGVEPTPRFKICLTKTAESTNERCTKFGDQKGKRKFTDAKGWYPGLELHDGELFFRDADASVVVPSVENRLYTTAIVNERGHYIRRLFGKKRFGILLGSGDPAEGTPKNPTDRSFGIVLRLEDVGPDNEYAEVTVTPGH